MSSVTQRMESLACPVMVPRGNSFICNEGPETASIALRRLVQDEMCEDAESVAPDEPILRKIVKMPGYYDPQKNPPIVTGAFTPNPSDADGLSFFLEREMSIEALLKLTSRPASEHVVVRLQASDIYNLGFNLKRTFDPSDPPGHIVIPELSRGHYLANKKTLKPLILKLVNLAMEHIVFNTA